MSRIPLIEALQESDRNTNGNTALAASSEKSQESTAKHQIRPFIIYKRIPMQEQMQSNLNANDSSQITRRPLRGNSTGLLMPNTVIKLFNSSTNLNAKLLRNVIMPADLFTPRTNSTSPGVIKRTCIEKIVKIDFIQSLNGNGDNNDGKQNICSHCRALIDDTICNHCGTALESPSKRFKQEGVINPFVTITKLPSPSLSSPLIKKTVQRRYSPLQVTRVNERLNISIAKKPIKRMSKDPPECYTLSSDEEGEDSTTAITTNGLELLEEKRKLLVAELGSNDNEHEAALENGAIPENKLEMESVESNLTQSLECRSVRIGSYKCRNIKVDITENKFTIKDKDTAAVVLSIAYRDITQIQGHFGSTLPILAFKTSKSCASAIRNLLQMNKSDQCYYDPESEVESQKRIIILPEKISDPIKSSLKQYFKQKDVDCKNVQRPTLIEITQKMANMILLKSVPTEVKLPAPIREQVTNHVLNYSKKTLASNQTSNVQNTADSDDAKRLAMYPLPPLPGGICITLGDYNCLNPEAYLNDAIIDFYLKYIFYEKLTEEDRSRTHIFSSFFYGKLASSRAARAKLRTQCPLTSPEDPRKILKGWTKHVDIFEKDFIIIPINQKNHWFLAIICYPVLAGDANLLSTTTENTAEESVDKSLPTADPLRLVNYEDSCSSEELNLEMNENIADLEDTSTLNSTKPQSNERKKIPCILIFDSLHPRNWSNVAANLRDYLNIEWTAKRSTEKIFDKNTIKGAYPVVPQQSNFMDCGIYLLQHAESFFKEPILDFNLPIRGLQNWFKEDLIAKKRKDIQELIVSLSTKQQNISKLEDKCSENSKIASISNNETEKTNCETVIKTADEMMDTSEPLSGETVATNSPTL